MQPIKLIAIDLDGTLLNEKKEISEYSLSVLRRAVEAGVYITVASGRRYSDVMDFSEAIAPGQPVICANGAMACLNDPYECVYCECLPKARLRSVVELLEKEKCYYHVYCDDGSVMESRTANIVLLVVSILTCGFVSADAVLALLGIVFASQARKHSEAGRTAFAQDKADTARWMAICSGITMGVRVLFAIGYVIFMVIYGVSMLLDIK